MLISLCSSALSEFICFALFFCCMQDIEIKPHVFLYSAKHGLTASKFCFPVLSGFLPLPGKEQSLSSFQYHISHFLLRPQKKHNNIHIPTEPPQENPDSLLWHLRVPPASSKDYIPRHFHILSISTTASHLPVQKSILHSWDCLNNPHKPMDKSKKKKIVLLKL